MASHPHTFTRQRPAPDATIGGTPPADRTARRGDGLLTARAHDVDLSEWETLGRHERAFLAELFRLFRLGKGAAIRTLAAQTQRKSTALPRGIPELFREIVERQTAHFETLQVLSERARPSDIPEGAGSVETKRLQRVYDVFAPTPGPSDAAEFDLTGASLSMLTATLGVFAPTGYRAAEVFVERTGSLSNCIPVVEAMRSSDRRQFDAVRDRLAEFEDRPASFERSIERAVVPYIDLIRAFQRRFDFLGLGLVPDEFVAFALDRFFAIGDTADPSLGS